MRRCIICGRSGPFPRYFERDGFILVRCPVCSLVFQDPPPDPEDLAASYYHDEAFTSALFADLREVTLERAREKVPLLADAGALHQGTRVLDVGASSGAWLEVAAAEGASGVGVELGASTAAAARARGLDVRTGALEQALGGLAGQRFDLITFWDVLEHLRDPRHELGLARQLLAPGGRVAATFPNVAGWYPRITYRVLARTTGVWEHPELPVHLYDFSPSTARRLFENEGYEVLTTATMATPYDHLRNTALAPRRTGHGRRGRALRAAFDALHRVVYPIARWADRGNTQFLVVRDSQD